MIAAFLLPFPLRGARAPYLWVYYRLLETFAEQLYFIAGADYLRLPDEWAASGRWELRPESMRRLGYSAPTAERMAAHEYYEFGDGILAGLLAESHGNPLAVFRRLLTGRIPALEAAFSAALNRRNDIEAILTWCNCPALSAVAKSAGIPVIHLEIGPLRWPDYRQTAYLDFSGVNGNTEANARYRCADWDPPCLALADMRRFFSLQPERDVVADHETGVVFQVEDDSNLVAFGNDFNNLALLSYAQLNFPSTSLLVRAHPGSLFALRPGDIAMDDSASSVIFIQRCRRLLTINSSVGLEALLMGKPVTVLGDCSYRYISEAPSVAELRRRLCYFLFAYLVPLDLIYTPEYLRFRLGHPKDSALVRRHLDAYEAGGEQHLSPEGMITEAVAKHR